MPNNQVVRIEVSSPIAKFFIGMLAGCAAIAIPRLSSLLISADEINDDYFPAAYIAGVIVFSVLIGLLVMIMEFKIPKPPKETLFAALAVPGLIAGSLNTAVETGDANRMQLKASKLSSQILEENGIGTKTVKSIKIIPIDVLNSGEGNSTLGKSFQFISSANAGETVAQLIEQTDSFGLSVQREVPKFAISIGSFSSLEKATKEVRKIRNKNLPAILIKTHKGYEILPNNKMLTKTDATIEAIKLMNKIGVIPKLLKIK